MQNIFRNITFSALLAGLSVGCAVPAVEEPARPAADIYSAVSFTNAGFQPVRGDSFAWYSAPVWADSEQSSARQVLSLQLQGAVNEWLRNRGYRVVADGADYLIGVAIITEEGGRSEEINDFFRLFPQLSGSEAGYDKGRILAGVIDGDSRRMSPDVGLDRRELLWRSAIEAYILDLDPGSPESRGRINGLTGILLNTLP